MIFKTFDTIDPDKDMELLRTRGQHMRAKSLPPPMHIRVDHGPADGGGSGGEGEGGMESSLDRKPSHLRSKRGSVSPEPYVRGYVCSPCTHEHYHGALDFLADPIDLCTVYCFSCRAPILLAPRHFTRPTPPT